MAINPPIGNAETQEREDIQILALQSAATANGNGTSANVDGFAGAVVVEVVETAGGTCTLNLEGSFDGSTWYALGYSQVDNIASPARAVAAIAVAASSSHVYNILDTYKLIRARISASGGESLTVTLRAYPV